MPLYKRKAFSLVDKPEDLKPNELVFQVRFTKEILRDYGEYLRRINLYRQRVWTCKLTGKNNLTYEEALVSENKAAQDIQQFPSELIAPVLHDVQFSMLSLKDLGDAIAQKLHSCLSEGSEIYARKNNHVYSCKIVSVVKDAEKTRYEVAWLDKYERMTGNSTIDEEDIIRSKLRLSRAFIRSFIRESTCRSIPWVLHEKLAKKHGIPMDPPDELKDQIYVQDGVVTFNRKRKKSDDGESALEINDLDGITIGRGSADEEEKLKARAIRYPIDDLLVQPAESDKHLTERPSPCREFNVPMECVGDILMVWDFCISFGRLLNLSPFSLEDFENAMCHKDSNIVLVAESHAALLRLLVKADGEYSVAVKKKKRNLKITLITWTEYLCDFLESIGISELSAHVLTIKRGQYGLLDIEAKLAIIRELVCRVIVTNFFKEKLDEDIEKKQALAATRREEVLEECRKRREEEEHSKNQSNGKEGTKEHTNLSDAGNDNNIRENGDVSTKRIDKKTLKHWLENSLMSDSEGEQEDSSPKNAKKRKVDMKETVENRTKDQRAAHKMRKNEIKEQLEHRSKEQRKEYLEREMEKRVIRTNALGKDKNYNRYWFFRRDGRIFVESSDSSQWGYYCSKEEIDALLGSLNVKGEREKALKMQLVKAYQKISAELEKRSKEDEAQKLTTEEAVLRRSTRVRAPPRGDPALAFLKYTNKWKEE